MVDNTSEHIIDVGMKDASDSPVATGIVEPIPIRPLPSVNQRLESIAESCTVDTAPLASHTSLPVSGSLYPSIYGPAVPAYGHQIPAPALSAVTFPPQWPAAPPSQWSAAVPPQWSAASSSQWSAAAPPQWPAAPPQWPVSPSPQWPGHPSPYWPNASPIPSPQGFPITQPTAFQAQIGGPFASSATYRKKTAKQAKKIRRIAPPLDPHYLTNAWEAPEEHTTSFRQLVVLDLNGTLLLRAKKSEVHCLRPCLPGFVRYLLRNFNVMVWTSAKLSNAVPLVEAVFGDMQDQLVGVWGRETIIDPNHNDFTRNVQVFKDLRVIWEDDDINDICAPMCGPQGLNHTNTILIDDTPEKAESQPFNLVSIPEFGGQLPEPYRGRNVLEQVTGYLEELKRQKDVTRFIHKYPFQANGNWSYDLS